MNEEVNIPNNLEINKTLKEFESKNAEQKQQTLQALKTSVIPQKQVSGVTFEEDKWKQPTPSFTDEAPKIVQLVIKWSGGVIKDQKQAEYVLLGFVIVAIAVSIFLVFSSNKPTTPPAGYKGNIPDLPEYRNPPTPQDLQKISS